MDSRRRPQKTPNARRLTRKNSSFLASVKSFVAAPLSRFFSGTDEFDDSKDEMGKRRRLEGAQNEPAVAAMDDGPAPTKKLRRLSPDRQPQPRLNAYLDPPQSAFASQPMPQLNQDYSRLLSLNTHHPTIEIPRNEPRTTLSPLRNQLSRTMSIDPPQSSGMSKRLSRDVSMRNISSFIPRDESMEPAPASSLIRPASMSARDTPLPRAGSSFRMRTSLTPQPSREFSEPPSLAALGSKPVFVRAPPAEPASKHVPTLGALVESKRSTQSPVRQSSAASLLFGTHSLPPRARPLSTAERIFQDLDAYKTPLKPTRVRENRSQSAFGTDVTDMFSRKKSYQRMPGARGMDAKTQNKTKPYAGQAGIRKHLARSRLALAEEQQVSERAETSGNRDDDMATEPRESTPEPLKDLKLPEDKGDTFKPVPKTTIPSQSSLRVGRTFTSRNHIERPARAGKSKFSASFDEDEEESEESQKERAAMEEAAKNVPVFNIPTGFSFAKDNVPAPSLTETASASAEPPIPTLPFSFAVPKTTDAPSIVPAAAPSLPETQQPTANEGAPTAASDNATPKPSGIPDFFGVNKSTPMPVHPTPSPSFVPSPAVEPPKASGSTFTFGPTTPPAVASETKVAEPTKTFTFGLPAPAPTTASTTTDKPAAAAAFTFGGPTAGGSLFGQKSGTETTTTPFLFGKPPAVTTPPTDKPAESSSSEPQKAAQSLFGAPAPTPSQTSFSFGQPTTEPPKTFSFGATQPTQPSSTLFSFGGPKPTSTVEPSAPTSTPAPATAPSVPFTFGVPASQPAQVETAPKLTFGGFGQSTQADDAPTKSFSFGPASAAPKDEAPKSAFPFGAPAASAVNAPFSFTTTPSTPLSDAGEKKGFSFGTTTPGPSSPSPSFSFGGGSTSTEAPKPFAFGTSAPARPVTPPNQDTDLNMDESPTREMTFSDAPKIAEPRPTLGFSFGTSLNTSGFGAQPSGSAVSTPTGAFGQPSSNPFGKASEKPEERKSGFGGGFGQMNGGSGSGFPFGGRKVEEPPRPATAGSFPFSSPSSATNPSAPFSFGGSANNSTGSTGFPSAPLSAPNSPSTFGNTATASPSFAFGALPITTNPFGFGSQPASPAPGTSSLPSAGFGSGGGGFGGPAPVTNGGLFGGSGAPTSAGASGGGMFTIGAAPVAPSGSRQIKKLPTRRGGAKR